MDTSSLETVALIGALLGVSSHLGYFIRGEHHKYGMRILKSFILAPALLFIAVLKYGNEKTYSEARVVTAVASISYFTTLIASILTYRAFFHPLRNFPGPLSLRLSKFSHLCYIARHSRNHIFEDELFNKYGEFVR